MKGLVWIVGYWACEAACCALFVGPIVGAGLLLAEVVS